MNFAMVRLHYVNEIIISLAVDCQWSPWEFGNCTTDCGTGYIFQQRKILVPKNRGGNHCSGDSYRVTNIKCNTETCPGKVYKLHA